MISVRLFKFSGSGSRSGLPRRKRRGTPDVHLLRDSWTTFTRLCRRKASVKFITYPTDSRDTKRRVSGRPGPNNWRAGGQKASDSF